MPLVHLDSDEAYPVFFAHTKTQMLGWMDAASVEEMEFIQIPTDTLDRWEEVNKQYDLMQKEMEQYERAQRG
jgi:hypothetical protein